jgi:hypothetical protein
LLFPRCHKLLVRAWIGNAIQYTKLDIVFEIFDSNWVMLHNDDDLRCYCGYC